MTVNAIVINADPIPFWRKKLADMSVPEWESLCDGCGRCCLVKLVDEDTDEVYSTSIACKLLNTTNCQCGNYPKRKKKVPDCVQLTPALLPTINWLPPTCAYRLVDEGKDLMWWHPLISGSPDTVHEAGVSVRGKVRGSEEEVPLEALQDYLVNWPMKVPRQARGPVRPDKIKGKNSK